MEASKVLDVAECQTKTRKLQAQFICPIWAVWFGKSVNVYFTSYHAGQFERALRLNRTDFLSFSGKD